MNILELTVGREYVIKMLNNDELFMIYDSEWTQKPHHKSFKFLYKNTDYFLQDFEIQTRVIKESIRPKLELLLNA